MEDLQLTFKLLVRGQRRSQGYRAFKRIISAQKIKDKGCYSNGKPRVEYRLGKRTIQSNPLTTALAPISLIKKKRASTFTC